MLGGHGPCQPPGSATAGVRALDFSHDRVTCDCPVGSLLVFKKFLFFQPILGFCGNNITADS
jgi:hypothetical protein